MKGMRAWFFRALERMRSPLLLSRVVRMRQPVNYYSVLKNFNSGLVKSQAMGTRIKGMCAISQLIDTIAPLRYFMKPTPFTTNK